MMGAWDKKKKKKGYKAKSTDSHNTSDATWHLLKAYF